jgi:hypothetical protein
MLIFINLLKKILACYGTQEFIGVHKSLSPNPVLSQMNPVHILNPYFFVILYNIILILSMPTSSKSSLPFRLSDETYVCIYDLSHSC